MPAEAPQKDMDPEFQRRCSASTSHPKEEDYMETENEIPSMPSTSRSVSETSQWWATMRGRLARQGIMVSVTPPTTHNVRPPPAFLSLIKDLERFHTVLRAIFRLLHGSLALRCGRGVSVPMVPVVSLHSAGLVEADAQRHALVLPSLRLSVLNALKRVSRILVRAAMDNGREGEDAFGWHGGSTTTAVDPFRIRSFPDKTSPEGECEEEQQVRGVEGAGWEAGPGTVGCSLLTLQTALEAWSVVVGEAIPGLWSVCQRQAGNKKGRGLLGRSEGDARVGGEEGRGDCGERGRRPEAWGNVQAGAGEGGREGSTGSKDGNRGRMEVEEDLVRLEECIAVLEEERAGLMEAFGLRPDRGGPEEAGEAMEEEKGEGKAKAMDGTFSFPPFLPSTGHDALGPPSQPITPPSREVTEAGQSRRTLLHLLRSVGRQLSFDRAAVETCLVRTFHQQCALVDAVRLMEEGPRGQTEEDGREEVKAALKRLHDMLLEREDVEDATSQDGRMGVVKMVKDAWRVLEGGEGGTEGPAEGECASGAGLREAGGVVEAGEEEAVRIVEPIKTEMISFESFGAGRDERGREEAAGESIEEAAWEVYEGMVETDPRLSGGDGSHDSGAQKWIGQDFREGRGCSDRVEGQDALMKELSRVLHGRRRRAMETRRVKINGKLVEMRDDRRVVEETRMEEGRGRERRSIRGEERQRGQRAHSPRHGVTEIRKFCLNETLLAAVVLEQQEKYGKRGTGVEVPEQVFDGMGEVDRE